MTNKFTCHICEYSSNRMYNLQRHIALKHGTVLSASDVDIQQQPINVPVSSKNVPVSQINVPVLSKNVNICQPDGGFSCPTCYKTFKQRWYLKRHEAICKGVTCPNQCEKCLRTFSTRQHKYRHVKNCKGLSDMQLIEQSNNKGNTIISQQPSSVTNNAYNNCNINNGTINNIVVNIRPYGEENIDHVTAEFLDARLKEYNGKGIFNMIKSIHFNPLLPENHNIRKHDKELLKVFDNGDWILRSFKSAIIDLMSRYKTELYTRLADDEFRKKVDCALDLQLIVENFMKFDVDCTPAHFYKCVRDVVALVEDLERRYDKNNAVISA